MTWSPPRLSSITDRAIRDTFQSLKVELTNVYTAIAAAGGGGSGNVPTGGTSGQFLKKLSATDFDTGFASISTGDVSGLGSLATASAVTSALITDGAIMNVDVNASAGITYGKLALTNSIVTGDIVVNAIDFTRLLDATGTGVIGNNTGSGDYKLLTPSDLSTLLSLGSLATKSAVASADITDGAIMDVDINASAAIARSKLADYTLIGASAAGASSYRPQVNAYIDNSFLVLNSTPEPIPILGQKQGFSPSVLALGGAGYGWFEAYRSDSTTTVDGTDLARFGGGGYDGTSTRFSKAIMLFEGGGTWSGSADTPTRIAFLTTPDGSGTPANVMTLEPDASIIATRSGQRLDKATAYLSHGESTVTRNTSTAEENLAVYNANFSSVCKVGDRIRVHAEGDALWNSGTPTVTWRFTLGTLILASSADSPTVSANRRKWVFDGYVAFWDTIDSSCSVVLGGALTVSNASASTTMPPLATSLSYLGNTSTTTLALNSAVDLKLTVQMSVSNASNEVKMFGYSMERIAA